MAEATLLPGCRVLDLADQEGAICGRILADLGADVLRIEPPGGSPDRAIGPFWQERPHPEHGLWWFSYNIGKRGLTLNLETSAGRALLRRMAASADFLIESFPTGHLDGLGLGYASLRDANPGLVYVTVSDFGREGPFAHYQGSDLVDLALGGLMYTQGDADRPPVGFTFPQAHLHAGADAAAGAMIAYHHRQLTGEGQLVDVAAQESMTWTLMHTAQYWDLNRVNISRGGAVRARPDGVLYRMHWPCKDGFVTFGGRLDWRGLSQWILAEAFSDDPILLTDWDTLDPAAQTAEEIDHLRDLGEAFFKDRTVRELYEGAVKWRFILYPTYTVADLLEYEQLKDRDFYASVRHNGASITYPGPFVRTTQAQPRLGGRAPRLGEHNAEVYQGELGLSAGDLRFLKASHVI